MKTLFTPFRRRSSLTLLGSDLLKTLVLYTSRRMNLCLTPAVCKVAMTHSRHLIAVVLTVITLGVASGPAVAQVQKNFAKLQTINGKVYHNVEVLSAEPDGLRLRHDSGVSKIVYAELPTFLKQLYPHDPVEAAAHAAKVEEANRRAIGFAEQERARAEFEERCLLAGLPPGFTLPLDGPITIDHVKGRWLLDNVANFPAFGDADRQLRETQIAFRKAEILSGTRDREAEEISLRHNLDWYLHNGKTAEAELARKRLADMQAEVARLAEVSAMERIADALAKLAAESSYRSDLNSELIRIRGELERVQVPIFVGPHNHGGHPHGPHKH